MSLFKTEIKIQSTDAIDAKNLLGVALRSVVKHGEDEEGNVYEDIARIERVIDALGEADRIVIMSC